MENSENIKTIVVVSDTHGATDALEKLILQHKKTTNLFIHLGDGEVEFFKLKQQFANLNMAMVKGNCDFNLCGYLPETRLFQINDYVKIFACHGHSFGVKQNLNSLIATAKLNNATIALFGHTHNKFLHTESNLTVLNPGSLTRPRSFNPSFAKILINEKNYNIEICNFI